MSEPQTKATDVLVAALIGCALVVVAFTILGLYWGLGALALLAYEGWALVNRYPEDTISEAVIRLSVRPLVPWMFGLATGWAVQSGFMHGPWVIGAWFFLNAHFFFQLQRSQEKAEERKTAEAVVTAAVTGVVPVSGSGAGAS